MILPSSKHAVIDGDVVYGDGEVTFEQNPFERPVTLPTTKLSTTPSVK
jgi:hypothetical protein